MNRLRLLLMAGLMAFSAAGCADKNNSNSTPDAQTTAAAQAAELTVNTEDGFDQDYVPVLKSYFQAIEKKDFEAYKAAIYPPFFEKLTEYYQKQTPAKTMQQVFEGLHTKFDEDGYDSWTFTSIAAGYYKNSHGESTDQDALDFLDAFKNSKMFDDDFVEATKNAAKDMRNIKFTLYAHYSGDAEPVPAVSGQEILGIKTDSGVYLFG